jgi:hypothetical protein
MLKPDDRHLLFDSLRPPDGYALDYGVGTTFSLDLLALLTAPLAFTLFDWGNDEDPLHASPLALLEAIRRYSDRLIIFCQAGEISIPARHQHLFAYLEDSVIEVLPPSPEGVFHPKTWVLRFTCPNSPTIYRMLCMSRNLTFDRSWDTLLVLEGELINRNNAFASNHPLGDFIQVLPSLATHPVLDRISKEIDRMQYDLRRVQFELPEGIDDLTFFPLGIPAARKWPFSERVDRILIVSPFISAKCLSRLSKPSEGNILISRQESLAALESGALAGFESVKVLRDEANVINTDAETQDKQVEVPFTGLHAKLYVADAGWKASVLTGSANATDAAFNRNVEFLVRLQGSKSKCGIDAMMQAGDGQVTFDHLLQKFMPLQEPNHPDEEQRQLEQKVEQIRRALSKSIVQGSVEEDTGTGLFQLQIRPKQPLPVISPDITLECWPITLPQGRSVVLKTDQSLLAEFQQLSFEALTSSVAFEATAHGAGKTASIRFVLNLPLEGIPVDRRDRILRTMLENRGQVLRLLLLVLSEDASDLSGFLMNTQNLDMGGIGHTPANWGVPLFESLVRALDRDPTKLDEVAHLVEDLRRTSEGTALLPEGFDAIWQPIWSTREGLRK